MNDNEILSHVKLHLSIKNPDLDDVWQEGFEECAADVNELDNPYPEHSDAHHAWQEGWWTAFYEEAPAAAPQSVIADQKTALRNKARLWSQAIGYRLFELTSAILIAGLGYQLADVSLLA